MGKFNKKAESKRVINHMGGKAFKETDKFELASLVLTSFAENMYYESADSQFNRIENLLSKIDPMFAAKLAIYARDKFHMRSMPHIVSSILADKNLTSGQDWATNFYNKVVMRPDDMSEILALYWKDGKRKLPNALRRGFKKAFNKFDGYQLKKYKMENRDIKLVDLINLVRPIATQSNAEAMDAIMTGKKATANTWEAKLTQAGQNAKTAEDKQAAKTEAWVELIDSGKIGYFALLRNLRNILKDAPEMVDKACKLLTNEKMLRNSKVLPFRFISAYNALSEFSGKSINALVTFENSKENENVAKMIKALNTALEMSVQNLPYMSGNTIVLSDNSGSMSGDGGGGSAISAMSQITTANIANLFATLFWTRCENTSIGLFGDRLINPTSNMDRRASIFDNYNTLSKESKKCGGSTEQGIFDLFKELIKNKRTDVDRIIVFSDCQIGEGCQWYDHHNNRGNDFNKLYEQYRKINPNFNLYTVTLRGYGDTVFSPGTYKLTGWSEKIFDLMSMLEQDKNAFIRDIESVEL